MEGVKFDPNKLGAKGYESDPEIVAAIKKRVQEKEEAKSSRGGDAPVKSTQYAAAATWDWNKSSGTGSGSWQEVAQEGWMSETAREGYDKWSREGSAKTRATQGARRHQDSTSADDVEEPEEDPTTAPLKARRRTSAKITGTSREQGTTQEQETGTKTWSENANFGKIPAVWPKHCYARYPINKQSLSDNWSTELPHDWEEWEAFYTRGLLNKPSPQPFC